MRAGRSVAIGLTAGVLTAAALALLNLLVGPPICLQPAICTPPLPGESGCGPVPETCSGAFISAPVLADLAVLVGTAVMAFQAIRGGGQRDR